MFNSSHQTTATCSPLVTLPTMRDPNDIMTLERMGAFHQSRLSFLRVLLRRLRNHNWTFSRPSFDIKNDGTGTATYRATGPDRTYTLVVFAHDLPASKRSDRVIADAWDATFTLFDGIPDDQDIERLRQSVPKQEAGRLEPTELTLSRANRSVRMFEYVVECLAEGNQPDASVIDSVGYLMRTTAVYGSGKFGAADRAQWADRPEFVGSFQPELLTVWLIRSFTLDLVEHLARVRNAATAVNLEPRLRRRFGVGNSTGLGMAPFLINHPRLIHHWIHAREKALLLVRQRPTATAHEQQLFITLLERSSVMANNWNTEHPLQAPKVATLRQQLTQVIHHLHTTPLTTTAQPWHQLLLWSEKNVSTEAQELLVSLVLEPFPTVVDELANDMSCDETIPAPIHGQQRLSDLLRAINTHYRWINDIDFEQPNATARVWYVSQEKLEPRLGDRHDPANPDPFEQYEQPLQPGRDVKQLQKHLQQQVKKSSQRATVANLLLSHPEFRQAVRRVQLLETMPYAEIRDNTIGSAMLPIDLLRCKLSFFGATHFDPRSDRWVRITLFQGAPFPEELATLDPDDTAYPPLPAERLSC